MNLEALIENIEELGQALPQDYSFNKPTLFINGGKSDYITSEEEPLIKKHFPAAEIETISNAGHWVHAENKETFYKAVMQFL